MPGLNKWEWAFVTAIAVLHIIRPSRGAEDFSMALKWLLLRAIAIGRRR